jgi:hypothetical protein
MVVPYYDPAVVFFAPRPGFAVGLGVRFGFGVTLGGFFAPWGWGPGAVHFDWGDHAVFLNNARWGRTWSNRASYVHPYATIRRPAPGAARSAEGHQLIPRSEAERSAPRQGRAAPREAHKEGRRYFVEWASSLLCRRPCRHSSVWWGRRFACPRWPQLLANGNISGSAI